MHDRLGQGFHRVKDNLEDICLDNPQGAQQLQDISSMGVQQGWLDADWDCLPLSARSSTSLGSPRAVQVQLLLCYQAVCRPAFVCTAIGKFLD